ncbi:GPI mannosyltransferase 3 [[Candida] anglica]|uniref:Mannosyltransferase n=1 Tax=[Candida] anglica TaxID=148631 RepID=A0ABP0ELN4_9ASCO
MSTKSRSGVHGNKEHESTETIRVPVSILDTVVSTRNILSVLFIFRLWNSQSIQTYFQADEFFQCLEPAHKLAFGYGYITWEWTEQLRSSIHPLMYAFVYKMIQLLGFNSDWETSLVLVAPKVMGAIIATVGEFHLYKFALKYCQSQRIANITLLVSMSSPFNWFLITRSFSNNLEMVLTTVALSYWPWNYNYNLWDTLIACSFGIVSCIVRPTNAVLWLCLGSSLVWNTKRQHILKLIISISALLVAILAVNVVVDYLYYGKITVPLWNFLEFNIVKSLSIFYGVAPWHFYILQGVPMMTLTYLPFLLHYAVKLEGYKTVAGFTSVIVLLAFSMISHKEIRFIYPLQPLFLCFISISINQLRLWTWKKTLTIIVILNVSLAYFFTRVHERGVIDVMNYLREDESVTSFGFLTPCHSTPWQSTLHRKDLDDSSAAWFLTCEPPLHLSSAANMDSIKKYRDESDQFYDDPVTFINENFPHLTQEINIPEMGKKYSWPSRLVVFEPAEDIVTNHLGDKYSECHRFFNSYFHWDDRRTGDVIVYCANAHLSA